MNEKLKRTNILLKWCSVVVGYPRSTWTALLLLQSCGLGCQLCDVKVNLLTPRRTDVRPVEVFATFNASSGCKNKFLTEYKSFVLTTSVLSVLHELCINQKSRKLSAEIIMIGEAASLTISPQAKFSPEDSYNTCSDWTSKYKEYKLPFSRSQAYLSRKPSGR